MQWCPVSRFIYHAPKFSSCYWIHTTPVGSSRKTMPVHERWLQKKSFCFHPSGSDFTKAFRLTFSRWRWSRIKAVFFFDEPVALSVYAAIEFHVLLYRQVIIQWKLLAHVANAPWSFHSPVNIKACHCCISGRRHGETAKHSHSGCLPGAIGTKEAEYSPLLTSKLIWSTAMKSPNRLVSLSAVIAVSLLMLLSLKQ